MFPHSKIDSDSVLKYLEKVDEKDVANTLDRENPSFTDFINLLSPAAGRLIEETRRKSMKIKDRHFGRTVRLYSPVYISNYCVNDCEYCGFRATHKAERRRLNLNELLREAELISSYGINSLLLVSGEDPRAVSIEYLKSALSELRKLFSYISIEIYPMSEDGYSELLKAGVHGLTLYQETYNQELYAKLHRAGPKSDYLGRFESMSDGGKAGFYNLGLGALLGLYDWRLEAVSMAAHAIWLRKHYWKSRVQFSFPRITPIAGEFQVPEPISEKELEQMILAFRIFFPEADLYLSTRETSSLRDRLALSAVSHLSAASQVVPGGYQAQNEEEELGQFTLHDQRSVSTITKDLSNQGLEVVFKDWDLCFGDS